MSWVISFRSCQGRVRGGISMKPLSCVVWSHWMPLSRSRAYIKACLQRYPHRRRIVYEIRHHQTYVYIGEGDANRLPWFARGIDPAAPPITWIHSAAARYVKGGCAHHFPPYRLQCRMLFAREKRHVQLIEWQRL